jgi:hypothetical protein
LQDIRKIARLDGNKQCVDCPEKVIWNDNIYQSYPLYFFF